MRTNPFRRRLAKRVFWLSEKLDWFKTPSRTYEWNENLDEPGFTFVGWTMLPSLSIALMDKSYDLDPQHWDHWSTEYDNDEKQRLPLCAVCGGYWDDHD
jgi:hypothetical protein